MASPKIIVLGSLNGNLEPAFKKLATLHARNTFTIALLTGDVFAPETDDAVIDALLAGHYVLPLPTYFTVGTHSLPERIIAKIQADEEICPNLHFLGRRSVIKTSEGIRIASLGGILLAANPSDDSTAQYLPFYTEDDAKSLKGANSADILLTSTWPMSIWNGSKVVLDPAHKSQVAADQFVADLCAKLKPRYHLSASPGPFFYEREPFVQSSADAKAESISTTRFISMAPYGNDAKQKAMYAFTLNKSDDAVPAGSTASPFLRARDKKRPHNDGNDESSGSYSRYGSHYDDSSRHGRRQKRHRHQQLPPPRPDQCFFCLSNPNLATHMCCSIGEDAYITTAKGPLPMPTTFAAHGIDFPSHFIIVPLPHAPTNASLGSLSDADGEAAKTYREMARFRDSLQSMLATKSKRGLGAVTYEISRDRNVHFIWQLVAVPADLVQRGLAEAAFRVEADNMQYPAFVTKEFASLEEQARYGDYFRVWLWAENEGDDVVQSKTLVMPLDKDARFDLQFGRRVLAKLLGLEKRVVWQECAQTEEEETKDVDAFREAFKEWDFTLE